MQSNDNEKKREELNELQSKLWNKDILELSHDEINSLLSNIFYQLFLVEISSVKYSVDTNEYGCFVNFNISGEAYKDADNIKKSDESLFGIEDEDEIEEGE